MLHRVIGDTGQHVGKPGLWVNLVQLGRDNQGVHGRRAGAATVRACEQPGLPAKGNAAQGPLGGIVAEADAPIIEEAGEGLPALEDLVHGTGEVAVQRQPCSRGPHPIAQCRHQRGALLLQHLPPRLGSKAEDGPFDGEQRVDPLHRFKGQG